LSVLGFEFFRAFKLKDLSGGRKRANIKLFQQVRESLIANFRYPVQQSDPER